ncbi:TVP38/TMEM64 family protein [Paenibacillus doosanensis]|uniref:TVP38/TMEM64 family protein n=1 Tax=Paenibacillus doosanensis TaxID=1229154 RepID=UPI0021804139|nr:TVP38/TMEM64 family protein [Paenibacillus doosanensis]MCS7459423.1 TVP38/TMEM64 family protein [Paenibacillus doosanensis]
MAEWNVRHLSDILQSWGLLGHVAGMMLAYLQTVLPFIPFVIVAGANVLIFGLWLGFAVNYVMAVLGAVSTFLVARNYARGWVEKKLEKYAYIEKFNQKLEQNGFLYIAVSRVIPVLPSFGINLAAAVMKVRTRDFVLGTMVGKFPMIFLESLIGHDLLHFHHNKGRLFLLLLIFVVLILIGNIYKKKWFDSGNNKIG